MSYQWIDRFICHRCGERVEMLHADGNWPQGWIRVNAGTGGSTLLCVDCSKVFRAAILPLPKKPTP